jgi:hypothetical protein
VPGEGEQLTGVSDNAYNLTSVLYHAAQGGTQYAKYIEDADKEGDRSWPSSSAKCSSRTPIGLSGPGPF